MAIITAPSRATSQAVRDLATLLASLALTGGTMVTLAILVRTWS